jgi:hypothetical protein
MDYKLIQITKINSLDFEFLDKTNLSFPVPPLASANLYNNDGVKTLKICATLYINSQNSQAPRIGEFSEEDNTFTIYFDYDWDNDSPETYDVWYVEVDFTSETVGNVTEVISYLKNLNTSTPVGGDLGGEPTLSRGTKTSSGD